MDQVRCCGCVLLALPLLLAPKLVGQRERLRLRCVPTSPELLRVVEMHLGRVLESIKNDDPDAIADRRPCEVIKETLAASIRLTHHEDGGDLCEWRSIAMLLPVPGAGNPSRWLVVEPERVTVRLALDQGNVPTALPRI